MANLILDHGVFWHQIGTKRQELGQIASKDRITREQEETPPGFSEIDVCAQCTLKGEIR